MSVTNFLRTKLADLRIDPNRLGGVMNSGYTGLLDFLLSPKNNSGGKFDILMPPRDASTAGSRPNVLRKFYPHKIMGQASAAAYDFFCDSSLTAEKLRPLTDQVEIRQAFKSVPSLIAPEDTLCILEGAGSTIADNIDAVMVSHLMGSDNQLKANVTSRITSFIGRVPGYAANTVFSIPVMMANGITANPSGAALLSQMTKLFGYNGKAALIGGARVGFMRAAYGIDNANQFSFGAGNLANSVPELYEDYQLTSRLTAYANAQGIAIPAGSEPALLIMPGAVKFESSPKYVGQYESIQEETQRTTVASPFSGIRYDLSGRKICGVHEQLVYATSLDWDLFGYPTCWTSDPCFQGTTDVALVFLTCADTGFCALPVPECNIATVTDIIEDTCSTGECLPVNSVRQLGSAYRQATGYQRITLSRSGVAGATFLLNGQTIAGGTIAAKIAAAEALGYTVNDAGATPDTITIIAPWTFDTKIGAAANVAATAVSVGLLNIESTATTLTAKLLGNALPANTVSRPAAGIAVSTGAVYFITANSRQVVVVGAGASQLEVISPTNGFVTAIPA